MNRIHILGASGSGTTTLGRAISEHLHISHFDTDDYYWAKTNPPYQEKLTIEQRLSPLLRDLTGKNSWVLSGSLCDWGNVTIPLFDLVVYLWIPQDIRIGRLRQREQERYGDQILLGGSMHSTHQEFMEWAALYDEGDKNVRSRRRHEQWLSTLPCKIIRIEGDFPVHEKVQFILNQQQS